MLVAMIFLLPLLGMMAILWLMMFVITTIFLLSPPITLKFFYYFFCFYQYSKWYCPPPLPAQKPRNNKHKLHCSTSLIQAFSLDDNDAASMSALLPSPYDTVLQDDNNGKFYFNAHDDIEDNANGDLCFDVLDTITFVLMSAINMMKLIMFFIFILIGYHVFWVMKNSRFFSSYCTSDNSDPAKIVFFHHHGEGNSISAAFWHKYKNGDEGWKREWLTW